MVETSSLKNVVAVASKSNDSSNSSSKRVRTGKLSSRNTRRKRRDHSAKKSKPPIPSFSCSPIIEEDEEVENEASTLLNSPSQRVAKAKSLEAATHSIEKIHKQSETDKRATNESVNDDTITGSAEEISSASAANLLQKEDNRSRSVSASITDGFQNKMSENYVRCSETIDHVQKAANTAQHPPSNAAEPTSQKLSNPTNNSTAHAVEKIPKQSETDKRVTNESVNDDTIIGSAEEVSSAFAADDSVPQKEDRVRMSVSASVADGCGNSMREINVGCGEQIDNAQKSANTAQHPPSNAEQTSQKLSNPTNKSSPRTSATLDPAPTSNRKSKEQHSKKRKNICNNNKATQKHYDMVEVAKPEKKQRSTRSNATETIEILDDDDDDEDEHTKTDIPLVSRTNSVNVDAEEKVPTKPKIQSKKRKRPETDPISVDSSDDEGIVAPKKTKTVAKKKKAPRQKSAATKSKSETNSAESTSGTKKRSRIKLCTACASCKCQAKDGSAAFPQQLPTLSLSGSGARVEQTLKNRLLKIERNIALTESQRHECARELKRHRGTLQKKFSKTGTKADKRQHFLADAQVTEEMAQAFATARKDRKDVKKIQTRVFGKRSSKSKSEPQPTLTQMFGGTEGDEDGSDDALSAKEDNQSCTGDASSADESSQADPHDSLSFWNDESIHATHQFIGSMAQFNEATSRFKDKQGNSTTAWTKATTNVIKNEQEEASQAHVEEEGIDALVELFDLSPKKKPGPVSCHDEEYNDSLLQSQLSQSGEIAAHSITEEIAKDDAKRVAIERQCPNWRENVEYSFRRKDSEGLENALNEVKKERQRLEDARDRILQAFLERSSTLDMYEKAIEGSLKRLAEKENDST